MSWTCPSCGTENSTGDVCQNCHAARPPVQSASDQVAPEKPQTNWVRGILAIIGFIAVQIILTPTRGTRSRNTPGQNVTDDSMEMTAYSVVGGIIVIGLLLAGAYLLFSRSQVRNTPVVTVTQVSKEEIAAQLTLIRPTLESHFADWKNAHDGKVHRIKPEDAGLNANSGITEVDYGYCDASAFYVYALKEVKNSFLGPAILTAQTFAYTEHAESPDKCLPSAWSAALWLNLGDGWRYGDVFESTVLMTQTAPPTPSAK